MQESLRPFCLQHRIHFEEAPQLLPPSRHTWLIRDIRGEQWVIKAKDPEDPTPEILKGFSVLHPPFLYPNPISEPEDAFLLYPYIQGGLLADDGFESPEVISRVMEVIGRMQAVMRSLVLVPFYQETMRLRDEGKNAGDDPLQSLSFSRVNNIVYGNVCPFFSQIERNRFADSGVCSSNQSNFSRQFHIPKTY